MKGRGIVEIASLLLLLIASGCVSGTQEAVEVQVTLTDFRISSSLEDFEAGVPYRFVISNEGKIPHEFMVMPRGVKDHHANLMEVGEGQLKPGDTVARTFVFPVTGSFEFACHLPAHYEAGMALPITAEGSESS